jgi:hypothetical protein
MHTLFFLRLVRSCLRDDHDVGAQLVLVPVLVVLLLVLVLLVLLCAESFLTGLSFSTMQVMYCIASFPTMKYVRPGDTMLVTPQTAEHDLHVI